MAYESGAGKSEEWRRKQWKIFWDETVPKMKSGEIKIPLNSNPNRMQVKAPTSDKDNWSQLLQQAPQIAHHGDVPKLPKLGRTSRINLSNFVVSDGAMGSLPKQLKNIPRETWMPHLDDLLRK